MTAPPRPPAAASPLAPTRLARWLARRTRLAALAALLALSPRLARADGAYGRLAGDLAPSIEAGAAFGSSGRGALVQGRLLYLATVGLDAAWLGPTDHRPWSAAIGAELRPLFLGRFLNDLERGPARLDLALDSIHFGLGARLGPEVRPGLDLRAGFELPLSASYDGFFVGFEVLRHLPHERLAGDTGLGETRWLLTLGLRGVLQAHAVDAGDRVLR